MNKKWMALGMGGAALAMVVPALKQRALRITNLLKKDHRIVSGMFLSLETVGRANTTLRKAIFEKLRHELTAHATAEEEIFYASVTRLEFGTASSYISESRREHQEIVDLMSEISSTDPASFDFMRKVRDLKEKVQHHVNKEESEVFAIATGQLYDEELEELGRRFSARKKQLRQEAQAA